ncbi:MAG: bifunctional helix-turn-helix transcriptional regulator/GNAT family N-acetyltransferase [Amphritea sp.]
MAVDKMQSFGSLSLGSRLRRLSDRLVGDVVALYQSQGIDLNPTFFPLFNLLHQQGALAVTQAAEMLGVSHPAISKIARKMMQEEWISKTVDPQDERRQLLTLTPKSEQLLEEIKPVWREIKAYLDQLNASQQTPILDALTEFENILNQQGFFQPVLTNLQTRRQTIDIEICGWHSELREAFKALNMEWLNKYFGGVLTEHDRKALDTPEGYYLAQGGYIWFAQSATDEGEKQTVGCIALARHSDQSFEISKMGVDERVQGFGVGRKLILAALNKARELGATEVYLESATKLERAIQLYRNLGFREVPHPDGQSIYPRSDIYMKLDL